MSYSLKKLYPLVFESIFKERIWGGNLIKSYLKKNANISCNNIGESWDICDREQEQSIVKNGYLKGKTLQELRLYFKNDLVGTKVDYTKPFPILVKIIDAKEDLSLQIHPKKSDLKFLPSNPQSKTEFWYILKHEENAQIMAGLKKCDKNKFVEHLNSPTIKNFINIYNSKEHTLFYIKSGTVHAIGKGNLILEIQENSDTTYRISDWERIDSSGNYRKLHIQESLSCIDFNNNEIDNSNKVNLNKNYQIINSPYFKSISYSLNKDMSFSTNKESCEIISVTRGIIKIIFSQNNHSEETIEEITLTKGNSALIPPKLKVIISNIDKQTSNFLSTSIVQ